MWTLRSRSTRRRRRSSRSPRASGSAASRRRAVRSEGGQPGGWPSGMSRLFRPLLELGDELLDLEPQSFQSGEELRLELALELFAFLEEILHQVAKPIRQLPPRWNGADLRSVAGLALLRQRVHASLLAFKGRSEVLLVYARERGGGFAAAPPVAKPARSLYLL